MNCCSFSQLAFGNRLLLLLHFHFCQAQGEQAPDSQLWELSEPDDRVYILLLVKLGWCFLLALRKSFQPSSFLVVFLAFFLYLGRRERAPSQENTSHLAESARR